MEVTAPIVEVVEEAKGSSSERGEGRRPRKKPKTENRQLDEIIDLEDDDVFSAGRPLSQKGSSKSDPISVEQYSYETELGLAIMASLAPQNNPNFIDLSQEADDIQILRFDSSETQKDKNLSFEIGQSSNSKNDDPSFVCEICVEPKSANESFSVKGCGHSYCTDCTAKYVAFKLQENVTTITCPVPGCEGSLEPEHCRSIIPAEVFDRWGLALCEALFSSSEKFYCPFKDCSLMLIDDGGETVRQSECPGCYRMFCAQCKIPWHEGIECEEFQKLNKDEREREDIMLMNLATSKQWKRCPNCRFYVERSAGCPFMRCRCGVAFCYNCGNIYADGHSHYCTSRAGPQAQMQQAEATHQFALRALQLQLMQGPPQHHFAQGALPLPLFIQRAPQHQFTQSISPQQFIQRVPQHQFTERVPQHEQSIPSHQFTEGAPQHQLTQGAPQHEQSISSHQFKQRK